MRLSQAALPVMLQQGRGAIINVSSVASFVYSAGNVNYCATKAYLTNFSEGLAAELRGTGVRVQALCPGFTHSEFHERMKADAKLIPGWMWLSAQTGGEILTAECAAPRASGVHPRSALQADRICAPPLTPFLHRLGVPAAVHRDVRCLPAAAGGMQMGRRRCNNLQCRSDSAALFQHPPPTPGVFFETDSSFRASRPILPGEDGAGSPTAVALLLLSGTTFA